MAHSQREDFPWRGTTLAIHLARLVSLAFGALTVWATWGLAREVYPDSPLIALGAAALVAFTPQFVFISSVTSNDSSAAALSTSDAVGDCPAGAPWRHPSAGRADGCAGRVGKSDQNKHHLAGRICDCSDS